MPVNATLAISPLAATHADGTVFKSPFVIDVSLDSEVQGFANNNVMLSGDTTGVTFTLSPSAFSDPDDDMYHILYEIDVTLPENARGTLTLTLTGNVDAEEQGTQPISSNMLSIDYDTSPMYADWGDLQYDTDTGQITLPVHFVSGSDKRSQIAVTWFDRTDCLIVFISGDPMYDMEYALYLLPTNPDPDSANWVDGNAWESGAHYDLVFLIPPDKLGSFSVSICDEGYIVQTGDVRDVAGAPKLIPFNTK